MLKILQDIVNNARRENTPNFVIKNYLKEYLQYPVLDFIYNNQEYKNFIFTGGSCLRICYNAPRLSEDLDFDLLDKDYKSLDLPLLAKKLQKEFSDKYLIKLEVKCRSNFRIYLKFPILKELELADQNESDLLYVKIEPSKTAWKKPDIELTPISNYGFNFIVGNYSLPLLMAGKLNAIFERKWFKGEKNEIDIKGRNFYDLFWYFQQNISPDWAVLKKTIGITNETELKKELKQIIEQKVTTKKLSYDLKNFFPNQNFVVDFCKNYFKIMDKYLS